MKIVSIHTPYLSQEKQHDKRIIEKHYPLRKIISVKQDKKNIYRQHPWIKETLTVCQNKRVGRACGKLQVQVPKENRHHNLS